MLDAVLALNGLDTQVFDYKGVSASPQDSSDAVTVPDAHLLFSGDFKRVGTTGLKITGDDGKSFFIEDYFSGEKPKNLLSPAGAMLSADVVQALAGPLAPGQQAQAGGQQSAQTVIGRVDAASGSCTVVRNGVSVALNAGDLVQKGDVVQTSSASAVSIVFTDGTTFSLSANARMVLNDFVYAANGGNNSAAISLVQGTFSFIAGQVAKTGEMRVDTPVATMGIRGTAVKADVTAADGTTRFTVMEETNPNTGITSTGSFVLLDKTTGQVLATVNSASVSYVLAPSGPQQLTITPVQRTPAEIQQDAQVVQQLFNAFNNYQTNPIKFDSPPDQQQSPQKDGLNQGPGSGSGGAPLNTLGQQTNVTVTITAAGSGNTPIIGNVPALGGPTSGVGIVTPVSNNTNTPASGGTVKQPTETITVINGSGIIIGTPGKDLIYGSEGADSITALQGNDSVFAGGGNDIIMAAHGEGNDFYDGGPGVDTIRYDSANGVVFQLNVGTYTLADGTVVKLSTADGLLIDHDEFVRIEKIVGSPGNDVFVLHDLGDWEIDGGDGVDIVRVAGDFDFTALTTGGPFATNIEIIDLGQSFTDKINLKPADVWTALGLADPTVSGGQQPAGTHLSALRILGGTTDVVELSDTYQVGGTGPAHLGRWQLVGNFVDPTTDNSEGDPFNDHVTDGVTFREYQFLADDGSVLATLYVQDGVQVQQIISTTNAVNDTASMGENEVRSVDVVSNDAPDFVVTKTLLSLGTASITGPQGVALGTPTIAIENNQIKVTPGDAFDALAEGETATISVPYTVQLASGQTLTATAIITVTGANDAPFFTSLDGYSRSAGEDDNSVSFNLLANAADKDTHDTLSVVNVVSTGVNNLGQTVDVTGAVSVVGSNAVIDPKFFNSLPAGQSVTITVGYDVSDGHTTTHNTATLTVTGANDAPYFSSQDGFSRSATEDDSLVTFNLLQNAVDPDHDALSVLNLTTSAVTGQNAAIDVSSAVSVNGNNISVDPQHFNYLAVGESVTITVNYDVTDGQATVHNVATLTVTGANDDPVITGSVSTGTVNAGSEKALTPLAASYLTADHDLVNGLGGTNGFGENALSGNDDGSTGAVDITGVFGEQGLNFFGTHYTSIYINNNGNITFGGPTGQFTPTQISGGAGNPIIAPFWADVDTRSGAGATSPGGDSTGSNKVYYDLDAVNGVVTITWDDVGYYSNHDDKQNAFQLQLIDRGNGDFDIVFRYENIDWTTGDASGGSGGVGGTPARAGYSAGDGVPTHYYELTGSGDQAMMLALETMQGNTGIDGVYVFHVRNGDVSEAEASGTINFSDVDLSDTHTVSSAFNATASGHQSALGILTATVTQDTVNGTGGIVAWQYNIAPEALSQLQPGSTYTDVFNVTITDENGGTTVQQVTVTINGPDGEPVVNVAPVANDTTAQGNEDANAIAVTLSGSDTDGSVTGFQLLSLPEHGWLYSDLSGTPLSAEDLATILTANGENGRTLYFKPDANWNGDTHFNFVAIDNDGTQSANTGHATVSVASVNDAPSANDIGVSTSPDNQLIPVTLSGTDIDGTITGFQLSSLPEHGTLYLDAEGLSAVTTEATYQADAEGHVTFYFVPDENWPLQTTFDFVTYDNQGLASAGPGHVSITATPEVATLSVQSNEGFDTGSLLLPLLNSDVTDIGTDHIDLHYAGGNGASDDLEFHVTAQDLQWTQIAPGEYSFSSGTITAITISRINENGQGSHVLATLTGLDVPATEVAQAVAAYNANGNTAPFASLFQSYAYHATGGAGADVLTGGLYADVIDGGAGNDILTGGGGDDIFVFSASSAPNSAGPGHDTINDFAQGHDRISFDSLYSTHTESLRFTQFSDLNGHISVVGNDTVIDLGDGDQVTLHNFTGTLTANDFIFQQNNGNLFA